MRRPRRLLPLAALALLVTVLACGCTAPSAGPTVDTSPARTVDDGWDTRAGVAPVSFLTASGRASDGMKTIGVIGGVSWVSSAEYYRIMNEKVQQDRGGLNSAKILMYSIEFGEFSKQERLADAGNWEPLNATLIDAARRLRAGGADFIVIGSNTLNSRADDIEAAVGIPVLRITDATGAKVAQSGTRTIALLGTKYTMEQPFYRDALEKKYGLRVVTPNATEREFINSVIFDELCAGVVRNESRAGYVRIIDRLAAEEGAEGVILGCTEIPLLIHQDDVRIPVFDTTRIHAEAAVDYAYT